MKLYKINCYGMNTVIGVNEEDAILSYLHRHSELQDVDSIAENLEATKILDDFEFWEIFSLMQTTANTTEWEADIMKAIDYYTGSHSRPYLETYVKYDMIQWLEWMQRGETIYGDMFLEDLLDNMMTLKELNNQIFRLHLPNDVSTLEILEFIGFSEDVEGTYRLNDIRTGNYYVYYEDSNTLSENKITDIPGVVTGSHISLGYFIDNIFFNLAR